MDYQQKMRHIYEFRSKINSKIKKIGGIGGAITAVGIGIDYLVNNEIDNNHISYIASGVSIFSYLTGVVHQFVDNVRYKPFIKKKIRTLP